MGYDQLSPIAPARVRCLLLPCGRIKLNRFMSFANRIAQETVIRLSDISPESGSKRGMFSPLGFPSGSILYDFSCSDAPVSSQYLVPFELYRQPLVILGIADAAEVEASKLEKEPGNEPDETNGKIHEDQGDAAHAKGDRAFGLSVKLTALQEAHSSALIHRIFLFDFRSSASLPGSVIGIPPADQSKPTALKTAMCDMTSQFLEELSSYARSVQALLNIETPAPRRQSTFDGQSPTSGSATDLTGPSSNQSGSSSPPGTSLAAGERSPYRASLPLHVSSPLASEFKPHMDRSISPGDRSRPPVTFDEIGQERPPSAPPLEKPRSANRVSVHGFGSGTTGERARNQARGRLGTVTGSMYLLAGRWTDAVKELIESATIAKWSSDHAWYGKALDYILVSLLMCGWAGLDFEVPQICYPIEKPPWTVNKPLKLGSSEAEATKTQIPVNRLVSLRNLCQLLPDLVNHILYFYTRAVTSSYSDKIPMLSFSESVIRFSRLLGIVRVSHSVLDSHCLQNIVSNATPKQELSELPDSIEPFASSAEIAALAFRAMPVFDASDFVEEVDQFSLLAGIASVLSLLGYHRKKAFVLRDLVTSLLPALVQSRKDNAAELGFHPAASLSALDLAVGSGKGHESSDLYGVETAGTTNFLDILCEVYGIVKAGQGPQEAALTNGDQRGGLGKEIGLIEADQITGQAIRRCFGHPILKMDVLRWCINICEALPDLPGMLRFSSHLLATASSGMAPGPESNDAYPTIPTEDQTRLIDTLARASNAMRQTGVGGSEANYWDEFLIREVQVLAPTASDLPIRRQKRELQLAEQSSVEKKTSPFIYNPFAAKPATASTEPTLLLNEKTTFMVLVQNLFDVNLELEWLKLDVDDESMNVLGRNLTIGPYRTQKVYLTGVPKIVGQVRIPGCVAKVRGCEPRKFRIYEAPWKPSEDPKVKVSGLSIIIQPKERPMSTSSDPSQMAFYRPSRAPVPSSLTVNIIKNQPIVHVKPMSLSQSTVMVLLGQSRTISITLINDSPDEIDFVMVSFTDSTSGFLQEAIDNKDLPPSDLYEAEYSAYRRPAFKLAGGSSTEKLRISSRGELKLDVQVFGKPGLMHGTIQVTYAHLGVSRAELADKFYTRQLIVPIAVTVNASVELLRTEVLPFGSNVDWQTNLAVIEDTLLAVTRQFAAEAGDNRSPKTGRESSAKETRDEEQCLLLLDFHNAWPRPLLVSLQLTEDLGDSPKTSSAPTTNAVIQPGRSTRLMMPIPRTLVDNPHAPIPAINPANRRQFVLSSNNISFEIEKTGREMFWYRENILERLQATWQEQESGRSGNINLRTMHFSPQMLEILRPEAVHIDVSLEPPDDHSAGEAKHLRRTRFRCIVDGFAKVTARITNRSSQPIYPLLRLQPSLRHHPYNIALDLSRKLAFNGLLQRPLPLLDAKTTQEVSLGIVFLCAGEYEIGACIEEVRPYRLQAAPEGNRPRAGTGEFTPSELESKGRRLWYANSPCLIDVSGSEHHG